jgi:hypothetical protein
MLKTIKNILFGFVFFGTMNTIWPSCNPTTVPKEYQEGYIPFTFLNSNEISNARMYITFVSTPPGKSPHCFLQFLQVNGVWIGSPIAVTDTKIKPHNYSFPISQFNEGKTPLTVYIPMNEAIYQLFISIDYPMSMKIGFSEGKYIINTPDPMNRFDSNYYHIYDGATIVSVSPSKLDMHLDYTTCFSLPIAASIAYNGEFNTLLLGIKVDREAVFARYAKELEKLLNPAALVEWQKLGCSFVAAGDSELSNLRLSSLFRASSSGGDFAKDFLHSSRFGSNWEDAVFIPRNLSIDLSSCGKGYDQYILNDVTEKYLQFTPTRAGTRVTIPRPISLFAFVSGDPTPAGFNATGDETAQVAICRLLAAGFVSGYLPNHLLGPTELAYANAGKLFYETSFCDLYSKVLHTLAQPSRYKDFLTVPTDDIPQYYNATTIPINSFSKPWVFIELGSMKGTHFPNFRDDNLYDLTLPAPPPGMEIYYNDEPIKTLKIFHKQKMPFKLSVKYLEGIYNNGITYESKCYVHSSTGDPKAHAYAFCFPEFPVDVGFIQGSGLFEWTIAPGAPGS